MSLWSYSAARWKGKRPFPEYESGAKIDASGNTWHVLEMSKVLQNHRFHFEKIVILLVIGKLRSAERFIGTH